MTAPLVAGNWKMNTTVQEGIALATAIRDAVGKPGGVEVAVLPPFTHLWPVHDVLEGSGILLGAQDVFWETSGAYTGEISPMMLAGCCDLALVGHSERRHLLGETDAQVGRKFLCAVSSGLRVIVAVGETESERDSGTTFAVVDRQLDAALAPFASPPAAESFVIAYEPVWAIGTGRTASPEQAQEVCRHIKEHLAAGFAITGVRVLYGGSVNSKNVESFVELPLCDGVLVGGASLDAAEFAHIVKVTAEVYGHR